MQMNWVVIAGYVSKTPEVRRLPSGALVAHVAGEGHSDPDISTGHLLVSRWASSIRAPCFERSNERPARRWV
jgi:hypothetical protein